MLVDAGFADVRVEEKAESREFIKDWMPGSGAEDYVVSANVTAYKPAAGPLPFPPSSLGDPRCDLNAVIYAAAVGARIALDE